ncbi:MAG TPA: hypothetical protein VNK95_14245, partial [Caldilineaceae bacterium]|nr:hypothetical protein [Caldilineaceae bacterium]
MQEVTCFHCNTVVQISPDKSLCTECGEDLQHLLAPDDVAGYYYHRAQALAASGDPATALAEVERGLTYAGSAELHLLAAILAQRVGRFDQMRRHVAAIAVDDSLRPEAEWLLRAHQARQQALRAEARLERVGLTPAPASTFLDELLGREDGSQGRAHAVRSQALWPIVTAAALMGLVMAAYLWLNQGRGAVEETVAGPQGDAMPVESRSSSDAPEEGEASLLPTPTPTPNVPKDVVQTTGQETAMADSDLRRVVIIPANPFDIRAFLRGAGRADLAALSLDARLQGKKLVVQGVVHLDRQRR